MYVWASDGNTHAMGCDLVGPTPRRCATMVTRPTSRAYVINILSLASKAATEIYFGLIARQVMIICRVSAVRWLD